MGDGGVETAVGEGHLAHISIVNRHSLRDSLQRRIPERAFTRIVGLIHRPDIDAYRATSRQHLCGGNEQEPVTATDIENCFISAELQALEEAVARAKFTEATAGEHESGEDHTTKAKNLNCISQADVPARSPYENETKDHSREAEDEHRVNEWGSVETIVGRLFAHPVPSSLDRSFRCSRVLRLRYG